ncbi:MAG: hypothetical protein HYV97_19045 [Bdellovibrio sp.]|nr:hypothetical protein [Bdellovibrio sp.]
MATSNGNKKNLNLPRVHCFICNQCGYQMEDGEKNHVEGKNFGLILKKICQHRFPKGHVLVYQTSCLGFCKEGISSVIYPQQIINTSLRGGQESQMADLIAQLLQSMD